MHEETSGQVFDPLAFKKWKPEYQKRALEALEEQKARDWKPFYCPNPHCDGNPHGNDWTFQHARKDQRPPAWNGDWFTWLITSGRAAGKTMTGSNVVNRMTEKVDRIALVGPTGPDIRETMVEGRSGILATARPGKKPVWNPSRKRLEWPNGAVAQGFSGEEPDRIRGANMGAAWVDEPAFIDLIEKVWEQLVLILRNPGVKPHIIATTTPKPTKWMRKVASDPRTIHTKVSTYDNAPNLNPDYLESVTREFEGTRFGRQELYGEILEDVEGALWDLGMIRSVSERDVPELSRVVVAIDPAGSANKKSDLTGIIVIGVAGRNYYVLADRSGRYSPSGWAAEAKRCVEDFKADVIVAEKNYGGDMVRHTLESSGTDARVVLVDSRRGKAIRAEPIVALYEKGRVLHVSGTNRSDLLALEEEQTTWVPGEGASPNRVDALVHGITHVHRKSGPASISSPSSVLAKAGIRAPTNHYLGARR